MGHADLLEDQLCVCRLQLVDVPRLPPINTQHSTVGCCASVSVGTVAQYRCGRAANAHTYLVVAALHVRRRAHVVPEGDRPVRADVLLAAQHVNPAEPVVPLHGYSQPAPMRMCLAPPCTSYVAEPPTRADGTIGDRLGQCAMRDHARAHPALARLKLGRKLADDAASLQRWSEQTVGRRCNGKWELRVGGETGRRRNHSLRGVRAHNGRCLP